LTLDTRKRKSECTDQEWEQVSAARRESHYTSHRHLGDEANVWLKKAWGRVRKRPAINDEYSVKGR
jgi:hypothetical protein